MEAKRNVFHLLAASLLGAGLILGLLLVLSAQDGPVSAAAKPVERAQPGQQLSGDVITVCRGGGCDYGVIQDAVDAAEEGGEIRVAAGTYTEVNDYGGLAQVVYLDKSLTIRGGYETSDWVTSDPQTNPTILDARGQGRVIYVERRVEPTLVGLWITGGNAKGLGGPFEPPASDAGGGIYVSRATGGSLRDSWVLSNTADAGGGIYVGRESRMALVRNVVMTNVATSIGGGLAFLDAGAVVSDNRVAGNEAYFGGGVYSVYGRVSASVADNVIAENQAIWGGGLYLRSDDAQVVGNDVSSNVAIAGGGGLIIHDDGPTSAQLDANRITSNLAQDGGGVFLFNSVSTLVNTVIADNDAGGSGSGAYVLGSSPSFLHTTLARNGLGGGTAASAGIGVETGTVTFVNSVVVSHTTAISAASGTTVSLESTLWGAGAWANGADWSGSGTILTGTAANNLWALPGFVDAERGDYHLGAASAAIDRGVDTGVGSDIDGQPRPIPIGGRADLGADESTGIELSHSAKSADPHQVGVGAATTYSVRLLNTGHLTAADVVLFDPLPSASAYISGSAEATQGSVDHGSGITWTGSLAPERPVTVTFRVTVVRPGGFRNTASITDAYGMVTRLSTWVNARRCYLPFLQRSR